MDSILHLTTQSLESLARLELFFFQAVCVAHASQVETIATGNRDVITRLLNQQHPPDITCRNIESSRAEPAPHGGFEPGPLECRSVPSVGSSRNRR